MASEARLLMDTHVWINLQTGARPIRPATESLLESAAEHHLLYVSVFSIWEMAMLERDGRLDLHGGVSDWTEQALSKPGLQLLPFSPRIAVETVYLPPPMHKDPADRIIVATARVERMTLVTSDKAVLAFAKTTGLAHLRA